LHAYAELIGQLAATHQFELSLHAFSSGEALLFHLEESPNQADIIYLDILMEAINGIETARQLRKLGCQAEIIFLTSSGDFVFESFDIAPVHYLRKELTSRSQFEQVFLRAVSLVKKKETELFFFSSSAAKQCIPLHEISYFEVWKRVLMIHGPKDGVVEFYGRMEHVEEELADKGFLRIHRSYLVNMTYIRSFMSQRVELKTGASLPVGVTYAPSVKKAFSHYLTRSHIYMP
jgi:DNA-binding LytR/AlgR family response regulator